MSKIKEIIANTFLSEGEEIIKLNKSVDKDVMEKIVNLLLNHKGHVFTSGCGTSAVAARKLNHTLNCISTPCSYLAPSDALHGALAGARPQDIIFLVSKGGNTQELVHMLDSCKNMKLVTIAVSENEDSTMARSADIFLKVKVDREPETNNMLATASTLAAISAFDAISIAVMETRGFNMSDFHLSHPGGAVGERLTGKVLYSD